MKRFRIAVLSLVCVMMFSVVFPGCEGGSSSSETSYWFWHSSGGFRIIELVMNGSNVSGNFIESSNWIGTISGTADGDAYSITLTYSDGGTRQWTMTRSGDTMSGISSAGGSVSIRKLDYSSLVAPAANIAGTWIPTGPTDGIQSFHFRQLGNGVVIYYYARDHAHYGYGTISGNTVNMTAYCANNTQSAWSETWTSTVVDNRLAIDWATERQSGQVTIQRQ